MVHRSLCSALLLPCPGSPAWHDYGGKGCCQARVLAAAGDCLQYAVAWVVVGDGRPPPHHARRPQAKGRRGWLDSVLLR